MGQIDINFSGISSQSAYELVITDDMEHVRADWEVLEKEWNATAYQSPAWVRIALETFDSKNTPVFVLARKNGRPIMVLPLVLVAGSPSILRWPGDNHCDIGCALFSTEYLKNPDPTLITTVLDRLRSHLVGPIVLWLKNQPATLGDFANPLLDLPHQHGPDPLYFMDVSQGMEAILQQGNAHRKRKTFRRQVRKANEIGGYEMVVPESDAEIIETLDLFFELKSVRLKHLGIHDVFEPPEVRAFLQKLALTRGPTGTRILQFYVLKVGGKTRAMYGVSINGNRCFSAINAVSYDEFSPESPGEMILYLMIEDLIERGIEYFDIGIGEERYKKSWCKQHHELMETIHPIGVAARPIAALMRCKTMLKHQIKSNPFLWSNMKRLRKLRNLD